MDPEEQNYVAPLYPPPFDMNKSGDPRPKPILSDCLITKEKTLKANFFLSLSFSFLFS